MDCIKLLEPNFAPFSSAHEGVAKGETDAVLADSIFHFGENTVGRARDYLRGRGVPAREDFTRS